MDTPGRRGDQIKELELKLHPELKEPLRQLCNDPKTTIVVLSGSDRTLLDNVLHLASIHGFYLLYGLSPYLKYLCRISKSLICGWQQRMGCFCARQEENG